MDEIHTQMTTRELDTMLAEAHRRGALEALKKMSEWALDCMEGEGPEAFEAYENAHVTAENLGKYYAEIKGKGDLVGMKKEQPKDEKPTYAPDGSPYDVWIEHPNGAKSFWNSKTGVITWQSGPIESLRHVVIDSGD